MAARDLSELFDFSLTPPKSVSKGNVKVGGGKSIGGTSGSGNGVAKRMLSRSRIESSFESPSAHVSQSNSQSLASMSSHSHSQTLVAPTNEANSSPKMPPPLPALPIPIPPASASTARTHARTYAGKSRSFLISLPASSLPSGSLPLEGDPHQAQEDSETRESYTDLRTRWGIDNSEDDPRPYDDNPSPSPSPPNSQLQSLSQSPAKQSTTRKGKEKEQIVYPNGLTNDLKSITELRSKGESRRFLDEVGYLFEGMVPSGGVGVRRAR
jgi:hypothetical protein